MVNDVKNVVCNHDALFHVEFHVAVAEQVTFLKSYILIALNIKYLQFKKIILFPCHKDLLKFVCFILQRDTHAYCK